VNPNVGFYAPGHSVYRISCGNVLCVSCLCSMHDENQQNTEEVSPDTLLPDTDLESFRKSPSLQLYRIIFPVVIGLTVVSYLAWKNFDPEAFRKISWGKDTAFWMSIGVVLIILRHLAYSYRVWILSSKEFSFVKCVELMFIWLFSSSITPTSVGGAAVALVVLTREKLSSARTAVIVMYTVVTDTFFFITTLIFLFLIFGPTMLRPGIASVTELDRWGTTFIIGYIVMLVYGSFFAYGLFIDPHRPRKSLEWITRFRLFRRFREQALLTGREFVEASREVVRKDLRFHLLVAASTIVAWGCRFMLLICIILAFVPGAHFDWITQMKQFARIESMFVIMEFSPTPGGSGLAEYAVSEYLTDWVPASIVLIVAFIWRLLEYYSYLAIGAIVVPNWVRKVYRRGRKN